MIFQAAVPYRWYTFLGYAISMILINVLSAWYMTPIVEGALIPDVAMAGYTAEEAWTWYESTNRDAYIVIGLMDLLVLIPCGSLWMGSQLAATGFPVPSVVAVATLADLTETLTHFLAVSLHWKPSAEWLEWIVYATRIKFGTIWVLMAAIVWFAVFPRKRATSRAQDKTD